MAVNKEIWIDYLAENFYSNGSFLDRATDMSEFVEYNTINLAECGVDPEVLVNNTTYPVEIAERNDTPRALPLDTLDTKNTVVRNIEKYELAYNKMDSVIRQHKKSLREKSLRLAAQNWAPSTNAANTPVLETTGDDDGTGFKMLLLEDVAKLQEKWDLLDLPIEDRILVLHASHRSHLLKQDINLQKQFANLKAGDVLPLFGFDIYTFSRTAVYDINGDKKAMGAAPAAGDRISSLAFLGSEVMKGDGTYDMFVTYNDPQQRGDIVGFQKRFIGLPIRNKGIASVISAPVA